MGSRNRKKAKAAAKGKAKASSSGFKFHEYTGPTSTSSKRSSGGSSKKSDEKSDEETQYELLLKQQQLFLQWQLDLSHQVRVCEGEEKTCIMSEFGRKQKYFIHMYWVHHSFCRSYLVLFLSQVKVVERCMSNFAPCIDATRYAVRPSRCSIRPSSPKGGPPTF